MSSAMESYASNIAIIADQSIEYVRIGATGATPQFVFLHEGLGSVAMWRDFPRRVVDTCGGSALVYSRVGYGQSQPAALPRRPDYMHEEALVMLPRLLDHFDITAPIVVGHSDGASIALIYAGDAQSKLAATVAIAPHVFVEPRSIDGIEAARHAFATSDLRARLARYHADVEATFRGWNDIWLSPAFRDWNIESSVARIECPAIDSRTRRRVRNACATRRDRARRFSSRYAHRAERLRALAAPRSAAGDGCGPTGLRRQPG